MKTFVIVGLIVIFALVIANRSVDSAEIPAPSKKLSEKLGEEAVDILRGAEKVEAFRLNPDREAKGDKQVGGFVVTAEGKSLGKESVAALAELLLTDETYTGQQSKCFLPGVGFRVWKGDKSVDVAVCFMCSNLQVGNASGGFRGAKSNVYGQLLKMAKDAFPNDKAIQDLPAKDKDPLPLRKREADPKP